MNREDFAILNENFIYFDNSATTFKPKCVVDKIDEYYTKYTANAHRGDYDNSLKVDSMYEDVRDKVKMLISAKRSDEIIFTSGATMGLNMVAFGFMRNVLKKGDEVLLSKSEHASNVLPWIELSKEIGIVIKYIPLNSNLAIDISDVEKMITPKTKVISLAYVTNTVGDVRPLKEIGKLCNDKNIYFVVDGAQGVPHKKIDVCECNVSFLAFSAHKMLGPTGVGFLYGKYELLEKMKPLFYGGGMNNYFEVNGDVEYKSIPTRFEAGTPNIAGVIGMGEAIDYFMSIGYEKVNKYEKELKDYLLEKLEEIDNVNIYNKNSDSSIVIFNLDNAFAQDTSVYLNHYHICVRAGNHCAKMLKDELGIKNTCRISLYFYNTKEEIDKLIEVLRNSRQIFDVVI